MTMRFNGTELAEVVFNGVDCEKVYFNGTLVFEKVIGNMLTVGKIPWDGHAEYFGFIGPEVAAGTAGELIPRGFEALDYPVSSLHVSRWFGGYPPANHYEAVVNLGVSVDFYPGIYRVTVGAWSRLLVGSWRGLQWNDSGFIQELPLMTKADFDAFPRSGTHLVTIERVS